jgi:hypothetical protein
MTSPILNALSSGYTQNQIISYLIRKFPQYKNHIKNAQAAGFSADKILKYLEKGRKGVTEENSSKTEHERTREAERRTQSNQLKGAGALAATAAVPFVAPMASAALSRVAPAIANNLQNVIPAAGSVLQRAAPQLFGQGSIPQHAQTLQNTANVSASTQVGIPTSHNQIPNTQQIQSGQSQQPPIINQVTPNIAQPQPVAQPEGISNSKEVFEEKMKDIHKSLQEGLTDKAKAIEAKKYLEKLGIKDKVDDLLARGNSPEQAAAALGMKSGDGKLRGTIDPELLANIDAYAKTAQEQPQERAPMEQPRQKLDEAKEAERKPIAKNETVASPHGVGEVITSRNGKSIIEVDGKKHQVDDKSLLKPPKEAAIEALELIKGFTPEEMRSTHHMLNAYDEGEKKGFFVFHNGSAYVVDDISPEEYKELSEEVEKAKTTRETIIGKWASGEGSRGAGYNKVVKGVRERKVVPELKKKFRKLKVGYNLLAEWQRLLNEK